MTTTSNVILETVLLPIDCLLETHLGTCALINPKAPLEILENDYHNRDSNDLWEYTDLITEEAFKEKWENRDITTLKISVIRNLISFIKGMIDVKTIDFTDRGGDFQVKVIINGFPYHINNELGRYMGEMVRNYISRYCKIEFINLDMESITPKYLKDMEISVMFLNDFNDWFNIHYLDLDKKPCPSLSVYVPTVSKDILKRVQKGLEEGILDERFMKQINPFRASEIALAEHLSLNYLPIGIFSIPKL